MRRLILAFKRRSLQAELTMIASDRLAECDRHLEALARMVVSDLMQVPP